MIVSGVPGRYATALFELALESGSVDTVLDELTRFDALIDGSDDLNRLVLSPVFSTDAQVRALGAILDGAGISGLTSNFVKLVARNRRLFAIQGIISAFGKLVANHRGEVSAEVTSAVALSDEQVASLKANLKSVLGKDAQLVQHVDPNLLGGLIVKVGSCMIDSSIRTKLNSLKIAMKEVG